MPVTVPSVDRLAFARIVVDTDVYRFQPGSPSEPVIASTFLDMETRFSPDGRRLAFSSMRSGDAPKSGWPLPTDQTHSSSPVVPDSKRLTVVVARRAQDRVRFGHGWAHAHMDHRRRRRHTAPTHDRIPAIRMSRTGLGMAAGSTSPPITGPAVTSGACSRLVVRHEQVTRGGSGLFACESRDGKSLLYQPKDADSPLLVLPLSGGAPRQLVGCVKPTAFATGPQGVYYVACDSSPDPALHVIDPETGRDRVLGRLEQYQNHDVLPLGLAVSPDGMSILYLRHMRDTCDLMLIENFR